MGTFFIVIFALQEKEKSEDYFQFKVERLVDQLIQTQIQSRLEEEHFPPWILTFGFYNGKGQSVYRWGQAPDQLPNSSQSTENVQIKEISPGIFSFIKTLEPPFRIRRRKMPEMGEGNMMERDGMRIPFRQPEIKRPLGYAYATIQGNEIKSQIQFWELVLVIGPLSWAAILCLVGFFWYRSRKFDLTLRKSQELIAFADASRTLSHEIRNPLSVILLQTSLLDKNLEEVKIIEEEVNRINRLVYRVKDFLNDSIGIPEEINLWNFINELKDRFPNSFNLSPSKDPGLHVLFDPLRFRSVLENLIKNAFESDQNKKVDIEIHRFKQGHIRIDILDQGIGLSPEVRHKVFTPFFSTKPQGSGIGLAVAKRFTEAAKGKIFLENRTEKGAKATVELPEHKIEKGSRHHG